MAKLWNAGRVFLACMVEAGQLNLRYAPALRDLIDFLRAFDSIGLTHKARSGERALA